MGERVSNEVSLNPSPLWGEGGISSRDAADEPQAWQFELKGEAVRRELSGRAAR